MVDGDLKASSKWEVRGGIEHLDPDHAAVLEQGGHTGCSAADHQGRANCSLRQQEGQVVLSSPSLPPRCELQEFLNTEPPLHWNWRGEGDGNGYDLP